MTYGWVEISDHAARLEGELPHGGGEVLRLLLAHGREAPQHLALLAADHIAAWMETLGGM